MKITTFNKLKKYESYLYTATYASYVRSLTNSQLEDIISAAAEIDIPFNNNHCPKCILKFLAGVGSKYFEQKTKNENNAKKKEDNKNENRG